MEYEGLSICARCRSSLGIGRTRVAVFPAVVWLQILYLSSSHPFHHGLIRLNASNTSIFSCRKYTSPHLVQSSIKVTKYHAPFDAYVQYGSTTSECTIFNSSVHGLRSFWKSKGVIFPLRHTVQRDNLSMFFKLTSDETRSRIERARSRAFKWLNR